MGLFDSIVQGVKSVGKSVASATNTVTDYFNGAKETVTNYIAAKNINDKNGPDFTLEMRQKALKSGPVGSLAYNTALSNQWLLKNPSSIITIGSTGKAGTALTKVKGGGYLLDFAKKEAGALESGGAKGIKNIAGYATSIVQKAAEKKGFSSIFQGAFGKVLAVGGLATGAVLAVTNTLDFYNWQGPIQTGLRKSFPWLFPAVNNAKNGKKTPEIKKMTPAETAQLQELFYAQTGVRYTGEELRELIYKEFGITVLELAPTKGNKPGPLAVGNTAAFQQAIKSSSKTLTIKPTANYMISDENELQAAAMNEIAAFIQAIPSRMSFDITFKKSFKDADGKTRKGDFAFVKVSITTRTGGKTVLAELPIGTTPPTIVNPQQLNAQSVTSTLTSLLQPATTTATPAQTVMPTTVPTQDLNIVKAIQLTPQGWNRVFWIDRFGVSHEVINPDPSGLMQIGINLNNYPTKDINLPETLNGSSGANLNIYDLPARTAQDLADRLADRAAHSAAGTQGKYI